MQYAAVNEVIISMYVSKSAKKLLKKVTKNVFLILQFGLFPTMRLNVASPSNKRTSVAALTTTKELEMKEKG